jgi:A/G-specific adenine glycosylase
MGVRAGSSTIARATVVRRSLLRWARHHGRAFLWRTWRDPYRLLVTEILLKQTRAESVAAMLGFFLTSYPNPRSLARAGPDLEDALRPLGFSAQRGTHLRELGRRLSDSPHIDVTDAPSLLALPGIGPYAAAMVSAVFGSRQMPPIDTNIARVVCRVFDLRPSHAEARKSTNVSFAVRELTMRARSPIAIYWAILDLAAAKCTARSPDCPSCPIRRDCAFASKVLGEGNV